MTNKKQLWENLLKRDKTKQPYKPNKRAAINEIKEWLAKSDAPKFDPDAFNISEKNNHWYEKFIYADGLEIIIEVYGSEPKKEKNWIKIVDVKNTNGINLDIANYEAKELRKQITKDIIKQIETNYGLELNNSFSEIERKIST